MNGDRREFRPGRREDDLSPRRLEAMILENRKEIAALNLEINSIKEDYVPRSEHVQNRQLQLMVAVGVLSPLVNIIITLVSHSHHAS